MKSIIKTDKAPLPIGPYSQGVVADGGSFIFTAGQVGLNPATGDFVAGGTKEQAQQAMENLKAVLQAAGGSLDNVVKITVFLKELNDFAALNEVFALYFTQQQPARSAVQVARLPKDALVEIEAIAVV
jgi:2-iminobutanoate/2-iminopropanoate deaminase